MTKETKSLLRRLKESVLIAEAVLALKVERRVLKNSLYPWYFQRGVDSFPLQIEKAAPFFFFTTSFNEDL